MQVVNSLYVDGEQPICVARRHPIVLFPYTLTWTLAGAMAILLRLDAAWLPAGVVAARILLGWWGRWRRRSPLIIAGHVAWWVGVFAVSWALLRPVPGALGSVAVVAVLLLTRLLLWWDRVHALTNRRVLIRHGVIVRVEESFGVDRIQHTTLRQGPIGRLLGYGDIDILSAGRGRETLHGIAGVRMFHAALTSVMSGSRPGSSALPGRSALPSYEPGSAYAPPLGYVAPPL